MAPTNKQRSIDSQLNAVNEVAQLAHFRELRTVAATPDGCLIALNSPSPASYLNSLENSSQLSKKIVFCP
jgi:hypothetical protein